jgi:hypothetical protein
MLNLIFIAAGIIAIITMIQSFTKDWEKIIGGIEIQKQEKNGILNIKRRPPLTPHEQKMYFELTSALPECIVLAQVAFSALITTESQATRNRFDRKVSDFVLCSRQLNVIAIIELDDWSHKGREQQDADRDAMLKNAGYTTIRYARIPTAEKIRCDIEELLIRETGT